MWFGLPLQIYSKSPQEYPLSFDSSPHKTLLEGKSISFVPVDKGGFEWSNIAVDNYGRIIKKKEVSRTLMPPTNDFN
jgi:hypothetical protein